MHLSLGKLTNFILCIFYHDKNALRCMLPAPSKKWTLHPERGAGPSNPVQRKERGWNGETVNFTGRQSPRGPGGTLWWRSTSLIGSHAGILYQETRRTCPLCDVPPKKPLSKHQTTRSRGHSTEHLLHLLRAVQATQNPKKKPEKLSQIGGRERDGTIRYCNHPCPTLVGKW